MSHNIEDLVGKFKGETAYIVGTGPSMRLFPIDVLKDKLTIGLNQAYKYFPQNSGPTYSITIHPYVIPLIRSEWNTKWITKFKPTDPKFKNHKRSDNYSKFILFKNSHDWGQFSPAHRKEQILVQTKGIQTSAIHLACLMGCKQLILVGNDHCVLYNQHHGHNQHVEFHNELPTHVYKEYYFQTVKCRELCLQHYDVPLLSLTPFAGLPYFEEDFKRQLEQRGLSPLPTPKEIEVAARYLPVDKDYIS